MIEIIAMSVEDAKAIEDCEADRIELVSALTEGGLTPSYALVEEVVSSVKIPVNVMIRPHAKSFKYSEFDIKIMKKDIKIMKSLGVNGVVLGLLDRFNNIDEHYLNELLEVAEKVDVTFHKAIDNTDVLQSVKILNKYKTITNILTAGGNNSISENIEVIKSMIKESNDINILLGGGLNFKNIEYIKEKTGATNFHFGTAVRVDRNPFGEIDKEKLKNLVNIIKSK